MGAPFWSPNEKQYFIDHIVPRSRYSTGQYGPDGRGFDELAKVMQHDMDKMGWSRRTYNADMLFQHWYQKVRPVMKAQAAQLPSLLPGTSQQVHPGSSIDRDRTLSSSPPPVGSNDMASTSQQPLAQNPTEQAMIESALPAATSSAGGPLSAPVSQGSTSDRSPLIQSATNIQLQPTPAAGLPIRTNTLSMLSSNTASQPLNKRSIQEAVGDADAADGAPPKKSRANNAIGTDGYSTAAIEEASKIVEEPFKNPAEASKAQDTASPHGHQQTKHQAQYPTARPVYLPSEEDVNPSAKLTRFPGGTDVEPLLRQFGYSAGQPSVEPVESQFGLRRRTPLPSSPMRSIDRVESQFGLRRRTPLPSEPIPSVEPVESQFRLRHRVPLPSDPMSPLESAPTTMRAPPQTPRATTTRGTRSVRNTRRTAASYPLALDRQIITTPRANRSSNTGVNPDETTNYHANDHHDCHHDHDHQAPARSRLSNLPAGWPSENNSMSDIVAGPGSAMMRYCPTCQRPL